MTQFDWIKDYFKKNNHDTINDLTNIIPNIFSSYYIIHWNVGIIEDFPFEEYPSNKDSIENINERIKIERMFNLFNNPEKLKLYREISLDELALKFKFEKTIDILDKFYDNPGIEILEEQTIKNLKKGLNKLSQSEDLNLYIDDIEEYYWEEYYWEENFKKKI